MKIKRLILPVFLMLFVLCSCNISPVNSSPVTVFGDGTSEYSIVYAASASDEELDLAYALGLLSGEKAGLQSDRTSEVKKEILIGKTNRAVSSEFEKKLSDQKHEGAFQYLVAEKNGKIVILADNVEGYAFAWLYITETYVQDDSLIIPGGLCHIKSISWEEYYLSDVYADSLLKKADDKRREDQLKQLEEELNRYEENASAEVLTVGEKIEEYKRKIKNFNSSDFGEYSSSIFTDAIIKKEIDAPTVYPTKGSHPRVLFTEKSLENIRDNLEHSENKPAYTQYMLNSYKDCDGVFAKTTNSTSQNMDYHMTTTIEAKAFRYALTGDKLYGYEAIYAIKNAILTLNVPEGSSGNPTRDYGYVMYIAGCVYDWCYDLLTEEDKAQIVAGCVNLLGVHMELVRAEGSGNKAPTGHGTVYGHGSEAQLLREWYALAIACYDEFPEIYELVAGRLFNDFKAAQDYFYQSGAHWEGSGYGPYRLYFSLYANYLTNSMTDGKVSLFSDDIRSVAFTITQYLRPDNQLLRIGDVWQEQTVTFNMLERNLIAFFAGNYYSDSYLKSVAYDGLRRFTTFTLSNNNITAVMHLIMNDVSVPHTFDGELPLINKTTYPLSSITARSAHDDENAYMVFMTMNEASPRTSHLHMDCGSFQIYYKGILASNSGKYDSWGGQHHFNYSMSTVSKNSLLIYNPNLEDYKNTTWKSLVYTGGQSINSERSKNYQTLDEMLASPTFIQCELLGSSTKEIDGEFVYSYLGGDMTKAYDEETVDEVTRYMLAVATGDSKCPLVFVTFDRITSDDASYRKSALIHMQEEPTVTSDGFVIITNTKGDNNGKLVVQSVAFDTDYTVIGGEGKEFWVSEKLGNLPININGEPANSVGEYGWGRVEISPANPENTNHMLTVMYVTDGNNHSATVKAKDISNDMLAGTVMFGKAMLFPKNDKLITSEASFTLDSSADCYIAGVAAGTWEIYSGTTLVKNVTVADGDNIITFAADAGTYTIKLAQ